MTPSAPHDASLVFDYNDQRCARIVERSVQPERREIDDDRSWTTLSRDGTVLTVRIEAEDLVALRAALNTWLTLVGVAEESSKTGERVDT